MPKIWHRVSVCDIVFRNVDAKQYQIVDRMHFAIEAVIWLWHLIEEPEKRCA